MLTLTSSAKQQLLLTVDCGIKSVAESYIRSNVFLTISFKATHSTSLGYFQSGPYLGGSHSGSRMNSKTDAIACSFVDKVVALT